MAVLALAAPAAKAGSLQVLYSFKGGTDGTNPQASVIAAGGALFGTTTGGGTTACAGFGCGTVFRVEAATGKEKVLYRFDGAQGVGAPAAPLLRQGNLLYGTSAAAVFAVNAHSGSETLLGSLAVPVTFEQGSGLAAVGGELYGASQLGGKGYGFIYRTDPSGGLQVVYDFAGGAGDGDGPWGTLIALDGLLYGTTYVGGKYGYGTVFQFDPTTGQEQVLHDFLQNDGTEPTGLIYDKGQIYGVTEGGGNPFCVGGCGTLFRIDVKSGHFDTLYNFTGRGTDGAYPDSIAMLNGVIYGVTGAGGRPQKLCEFGCGTLFHYDLATRTEAVDNFFATLRDGTTPLGVTAFRGVVYGTTQGGGDLKCEGGGGCGVVFAYTP
jgi:uncharacterized repeat protein (TIGR03803 family)